MIGDGICLVQGSFSGTLTCGTGFLISSNRILTAAHNVHTGRVLADFASVSFGVQGKVVVGGRDLYVLSAFYRPLNDPFYNPDDYDVALLRLDRPVGGQGPPCQ